MNKLAIANQSFARPDMRPTRMAYAPTLTNASHRLLFVRWIQVAKTRWDRIRYLCFLHDHTKYSENTCLVCSPMPKRLETG